MAHQRISRFFFLLLLTSAIASCNGSKSPEQTAEVKPQEILQLIRIDQPTNGTMYTQGEMVDLTFRLVNDTIMPDSVVLYVDSKRITQLNGKEYSLTTDQFMLGTRLVRATAWHKGNRQTASVGIKLKANQPPQKMSFRVVNTFPHDIEAYTQGLFFHNGYLVESTGQKGSSSLRRVELKTGKVLQSVNLDRQYFGEGTTLYNGEIYQLTWTSRKGFVYDPETFNLIRTFDYLTQGWGLTTKGDTLIMSDGSNILYFLEPKSFTELKRIEVYDNVGPVSQLNELEFIDGLVYANVYQTDKIVKINPASGMVEAEVDFKGLISQADMHRNLDVFNGIAWDKEGQRLFVTGKNWPKLFQVEIF